MRQPADRATPDWSAVSGGKRVCQCTRMWTGRMVVQALTIRLTRRGQRTDILWDASTIRRVLTATILSDTNRRADAAKSFAVARGRGRHSAGPGRGSVVCLDVVS
jgi:hypothetical protein